MAPYVTSICPCSSVHNFCMYDNYYFHQSVIANLQILILGTKSPNGKVNGQPFFTIRFLDNKSKSIISKPHFSEKRAQGHWSGMFINSLQDGNPSQVY